MINQDEICIILNFLHIYDLQRTMCVSKEWYNIVKHIAINHIYNNCGIKFDNSQHILHVLAIYELYIKSTIPKKKLKFNNNFIDNSMILINKGIINIENNIILNQKLDARTYMILFSLGYTISSTKFKNNLKLNINKIVRRYVLQHKKNLQKKDKDTIIKFNRYNRIICNIFHHIEKNTVLQSNNNLEILHNVLQIQ